MQSSNADFEVSYIHSVTFGTILQAAFRLAGVLCVCLQGFSLDYNQIMSSL